VIERAELLELCQRTVARALELGADQVEVCASSGRASEVELQKDDMHTAATEDETSFGIRVLRRGSLGFATVNGPGQLAAACRDALELASATPADEYNGLPDPLPCEPFERVPDPELLDLGIDALVELAASMLQGVRERDARVRIDSGSVGTSYDHYALATSTGIALSESHASASANLFGMAVEGEDIGSFDYDSIRLLRANQLAAGVSELEQRFVEKCVGALGARSGESFVGSVILSPEVVRSFLLGDLLPVLSAKAVRTGRSPLAERRGSQVAASAFTLIDDGRRPDGTASSAYDREGMPTARHVLIEQGVLEMFLFDSYEATRAKVKPTGHACGAASSLPSIGTSNLEILPGSSSYTELLAQPERAVLVTRLSGSSSPVTGEFSGVVKGGFLLRRGERVPIRETMIAGNLYDVLQSISGISAERFDLQGCARIPAIRVEGISVTAG